MLLLLFISLLLYSLCSFSPDGDDVIKDSDKNYFVIYTQHI